MGSVVLDASAVIALTDSADAHHRRIVDALPTLGRHSPHVPAIAYAEVMVGAFRAGGETLRATETFFFEQATIVALSADVARAGAMLRARHRGLGLPDATIIATGEQLGAEAIVTADQRWASVSDRVLVI